MTFNGISVRRLAIDTPRICHSNAVVAVVGVTKPVYKLSAAFSTLVYKYDGRFQSFRHVINARVLRH